MRQRPSRLRCQGAGALVLAFAAAMAAPAAAAAQRDRGRPRPGRPTRASLRPGVEAPDFELAPLTFETDDKGNTVGKIGEKKVKLSDFRGKKPVCIFSSSYT